MAQLTLPSSTCFNISRLSNTICSLCCARKIDIKRKYCERQLVQGVVRSVYSCKQCSHLSTAAISVFLLDLAQSYLHQCQLLTQNRYSGISATGNNTRYIMYTIASQP